ncbi:hypothetical protein V493_02812, partial [Pseudogymnoascus sp. VKM F-4281 (FW-2241)]
MNSTERQHLFTKEEKSAKEDPFLDLFYKKSSFSTLKYLSHTSTVQDHHDITMTPPSQHLVSSPFPANNPHCSFSPQNHPSYTSKNHASTPTRAPAMPPSYNDIADLSPSVFGTYPHNSQQLNLQEKDLSYQPSSSPTSSSSSDTQPGSSGIHTPFPPRSTPTTPSSHTPQHISKQQLWDSPIQIAEGGYPGTPTTFAAFDGATPLSRLTTTSPSIRGTPIIPIVGAGLYIGTPSTPPPPLTPPFVASSPVFNSPTSSCCSDFGGGAVGEEDGQHRTNWEMLRMMADREGDSKFPASLRKWMGFETPRAGREKRISSGRRGDELVSPRTNASGFETKSPSAEGNLTPGGRTDEHVSPCTNT